MSLRQFVCVCGGGEGAPASVAGAFPTTQTGEDSKKWTYENGIAVLRI